MSKSSPIRWLRSLWFHRAFGLRFGSGLSLLTACAALSAGAVNLRWDATPAAAGLQDGSGNWSNLGTLTNWSDGTRNVAWIPDATAVFGSNLLSNATISLTN